ncbi:MAG: aminoglycoside phosphotransferase family protein [Planctomycetes bacterium]|nr:aminoglycoside phosphotransferase family protein [Planctomycetota bacterium]
MARRSSRQNSSYLRHLIQRSLEDCPGFGVRVEVEGKINPIPEGLWHDNYWFWLKAQNLPTGLAERPYILRLLERRYDWQAGPEPRDRLLREAETLQVLNTVDFPHPTPEFICFVKDDEAEPIGLIETVVPGVTLDDFKDRTTLELIGRVAAAVHRMAIEQFSHLPSNADRPQHVRARLNELDAGLFSEFPLANEVRQWIQTHLPSGGQSCVLHGDLLPQNLLGDWPTSSRENAMVGLVDWEMAQVGDPAYDLAIVSRGNRKVLGVKEGLRVLFEEYSKSGGRPISLTDVHVHELLLVLNWLEESWCEYQKSSPSGQGPDFYETQLRSLYRRLGATADQLARVGVRETNVRNAL